MEFSFPPYRREFISIPNVDQWGYCRFFSTDTGVRDILDSEVNEYYGVDPCGHCPIEDDTVEVTVSEVSSVNGSGDGKLERKCEPSCPKFRMWNRGMWSLPY